ncbi:MAG: acetate--CoA ligase family protein [Candidatus Heimdallarchaeota archaeon]|nr:acetate--CoA ligase family protein [Candidatus Heimdallarchaeota archaeon]MCK4955212.1 acetate--CoA ligase family protein [Candidatus Heimdallarchaeota archaeon]
MNEKIRLILDAVKKEERSILNYEESREIMKIAGIPLNEMKIAKNRDEAIFEANNIGYPIVLKIISKEVLHKSDAGGVKIGIKSDAELKEAYEEMMKNIKQHYPNAIIEGVSIEEMVEGVELLIGTNTDSQFGKMIALGIGGIFVEIYKDISFRLIPITKEDVKEMINEIKGKKLLDGYRGMPIVDKEKLISLTLKVSQIIEENPSIKEMDLNPIVATNEGLKAIDARIILE